MIYCSILMFIFTVFMAKKLIVDLIDDSRDNFLMKTVYVILLNI